MKMFKQALTIFFKELKCIIRDAKTFFVGILIPFLLIPIILFIISFSVGGVEQSITKNINIAISSKDNCFYGFMSAQDRKSVV